ncbi:MAG: winged helix-turn-helix transcriptional regulator [Candidatus Bathyarchaeota archaeon]|nr:MAG: winged helix-turn-helix transcriptional regulator [Candidatus Bathyarchaeota archaeon]UCD39953.1 MAG: winged helix-turn-helix transcriptional regulator [Candidatus Bathyarchaeota archaeon]
MIAETAIGNLKGFDPEIRLIEKDIVAFFKQKGAEFGGKDPMFMAILAYFYVRERLTQQDLQNLSGFSAGTVSKVLRQLVEINIITKRMIPGTHKHLYTMDQPPVTFSQFYLPTERILLKYEDELKQIKAHLIAHTSEMRRIRSFSEVLAAVTLLQGSVHLVSTLIAEMKKEAEKQAKK